MSSNFGLAGSPAAPQVCCKPCKNEVPGGYSNPLKNNGLVRVKYGFGMGWVRVWKTRGFSRNPGFSYQNNGFGMGSVWVGNGFGMGSESTLFFSPKQ